MALANTGRGAGIGSAVETTHGTAVARSVWNPVRSVALQTKLNQAARPDLYSGQSAMSRGHHTVSIESGGAISMLATYDGIGLFLKLLMGAASTGGGPSSYDHTYTLSNTIPSATIEVIRGNSTNSQIFEGCKANSGTLSVTTGEPMILDLDIIAETSASRASAGSPSYPSVPLILGSDAGQFAFNGASYDLASMRLSISNNLERRDQLGSTLSQEPNRSGNMSVSMEVTIQAVGGVNDTLLAAQLAGTTSDATITFTSAAVADRSLAITLQNAWIESASDPVTSAGIITQTLQLQGESDGTDLGLQIIAINASASAIT